MPQHRSIRLQRDVDGGNRVLLCTRWRCVYEQYYQAKPERHKAFRVFHHGSKNLLIRPGQKNDRKSVRRLLKTLRAVALAHYATSADLQLAMSLSGTFRKCCDVRFTGVIRGKAEATRTSSNCCE